MGELSMPFIRGGRGVWKKGEEEYLYYYSSGVYPDMGSVMADYRFVTQLVCCFISLQNEV